MSQPVYFFSRFFSLSGNEKVVTKLLETVSKQCSKINNQRSSFGMILFVDGIQNSNFKKFERNDCSSKPTENKTSIELLTVLLV